MKVFKKYYLIYQRPSDPFRAPNIMVGTFPGSVGTYGHGHAHPADKYLLAGHKLLEMRKVKIMARR